MEKLKKKPMTKKQLRATKRNWLIMRLMGARSIFSHDNSVFIEDILKENSFYLGECEEALEDLINAIRRT